MRRASQLLRCRTGFKTATADVDVGLRYAAIGGDRCQHRLPTLSCHRADLLTLHRRRVSCNASYACPAPLLDAAGTAPLAGCSGHGTCLSGAAAEAAGLGASQPAGCSCDAGWGDEGCGTAVTPLGGGDQVADTVGTGFWSFYELQVQHTLTLALVTVPTLFSLKPAPDVTLTPDFHWYS